MLCLSVLVYAVAPLAGSSCGSFIFRGLYVLRLKALPRQLALQHKRVKAGFVDNDHILLAAGGHHFGDHSIFGVYMVFNGRDFRSLKRSFIFFSRPESVVLQGFAGFCAPAPVA